MKHGFVVLMKTTEITYSTSLANPLTLLLHLKHFPLYSDTTDVFERHT